MRDPLAVTTFDEAQSETEERWVTIGRALTGECLTVAHTWIELDADSAKARIKAKPSERRWYEEEL